MADEKENKNLRIDITSGAVEQGFKLASEFLSKLIMPTVEETGLLIKDSITEWRIRKQVRILIRTEEYCKKFKIEIKPASLKLLVPLLESASLEEDEFLQDKWSVLLGNMVDTQRNVQNNVLPFILSQISKDEYLKAQGELREINNRVSELQEQIIEHQLQLELSKKNKDPDKPFATLHTQRQINDLKREIPIAKFIQEYELDSYELANLVRCGVLKAIPLQLGHHRGISVTGNEGDLETESFEIEISHLEDRYVFTDLGRLFFEITTEKQNKLD